MQKVSFRTLSLKFNLIIVTLLYGYLNKRYEVVWENLY